MGARVDVLMLVTSDVARDARVLREAAALAAAGHRVHVQGKDVPEGWQPAGFTVGSAGGGSGLRRTTAPVGRQGRALRAARWLLLPRHRRRVWREWTRQTEAAVRDRTYDVVHAHDFTTLPLAARLAAARGARLVYDAHEWWSGRQRHGRPTPLERRRERRAEAGLVARADAVLTVSEGIAERLGRWAGRPVTVVRNTFPRAAGTPAVPRAPRGVVYAGRIGGGRDLETVLAGAAELGPELATVLVGPADAAYLARLDLVRSAVELRPPLDGDAVDEVLRECGLPVVTLTDTCDNHRLALPNKLFHAVRAGVPVVAADLPELRRVVLRYGIGEVYRPSDAASYAAAVRRAAARYGELCAAVAAAADELSWERDAAPLVAVYAELERAAGRTGAVA
jgi:glycosyltransferase involved in cell wall biosynthesis